MFDAKKGYNTLFYILSRFSFIIGFLLCVFALSGCEKKAKLKEGTELDVLNTELPDIILADDKSILPSIKLSPQIAFHNTVANSRSRIGNIPFKWFKNEKSHSYKMKNISFKVMANYLFPLSSIPIVTNDDKLIVLDTSGMLYAFNSQTGEVIWKTLSAGIGENGIIDRYLHKYMMAGGVEIDGENNVIFVTNGTSYISAFNLYNGAKLWNTKISSLSRSIPVVLKDYLVIQGANDSIFCLDKKSGNVRWSSIGMLQDLDVRSSISHFPIAYKDNQLLFQNINGTIIILEVEHGDEKSRFDIQKYYNFIKSEDSIVQYAPLIYGDRLYSTNNSGYLTAVDITKGNMLWQKNLNIKQPFWLVGNVIYAVNDNGQLIAINTENGGIHWVINLHRIYTHQRKFHSEINENNMFSSPVVVGDNVMVVTYDGLLLGFNPITGAKTIEIKVHNRSVLPILIQGNSFYIFSKDGTINRYFID